MRASFLQASRDRRLRLILLRLALLALLLSGWQIASLELLPAFILPSSIAGPQQAPRARALSPDLLSGAISGLRSTVSLMGFAFAAVIGTPCSVCSSERGGPSVNSSSPS